MQPKCRWPIRNLTLKASRLLSVLLLSILSFASLAKGRVTNTSWVTNHRVATLSRRVPLVFAGRTLAMEFFQAGQANTAPPPQHEDPVVQGVAEGALSIVALGFAAFTFLYNTLLVVTGPPDKVEVLKEKLRRALFATVFAIVSSAVLAVLAFASIKWNLPVLGDVASGMAVAVLAVLSYIAISMAWDVHRKV